MCTKFPSIKIFFLVKYSDKFTVELCKCRISCTSMVEGGISDRGCHENLQVSANGLKLPLLSMFSLPLH